MKIVGMAGGTASGKTSIARALRDHLGADRCALLSHDRYYRPLSPTQRADPAAHNFDHPEALESALLLEHLHALRAGQVVQVPVYDFATHDRVGLEPFEPRPIVLVEGILVFADPTLRAAFDHRVFVHAPADVRLARRLERDVAERGRHLTGVLRQYLHTVRPMHEAHVEPLRPGADLELDGTTPIEASVRRIVEALDLFP